MRTKGWERLGYRSVLRLKNLVPFIVLMDSLNSRNKSICLFLPQIYRHLLIYWDFLFRLGAADFQVTCTRQRFNSLCQAEQQKALQNPPPGLISSDLCHIGSPSRTWTPQLAHHYPSDSCLFVRMRGRETRCLVLLCDTEFYMMRKSLVCMGTGPTKHTQNATSAPHPPRQRHKEAASAPLLSALIWPWRISCTTLLLQWEGITNVGKTSEFYLP